jgi:hypothetical protein
MQNIKMRPATSCVPNITSKVFPRNGNGFEYKADMKHLQSSILS